MARFLALGLIALPLIEIAIFIKVGQTIGLWPTLALVIGAALLGGLLLLFVTLHIARGVAHVHGQMAKHLLVKVAPPAPSHDPAMPATASSASPAG